MEKKIYNGTAHEINIISKESTRFDEKIRKFVSSNPVIIKKIEKNSLLNAIFEEIEYPAIDNIPVVCKKIVEYNELPKEYDVIICSALYYKAIQDLKGDISKLYTVINPVYDETGKTVLGCLAIGKV